MSTENHDNLMHAPLARMNWKANPTVRLHYHPVEDTLVVELVEADAAVEGVALDRLLVEFDGDDAGALPTTFVLTGVRTDPGHPAVALAREVLGNEIWAPVEALLDCGSRRADFWLEPVDAAKRWAAWRGLVDRLHGAPPTVQVPEPRPAEVSAVVPVEGERRIIGVEFTRGRVYAVLTDGDATVLDEETVTLAQNDPEAVVDAIAAVVDALDERHRNSPAAAGCPIAVQLGGPVDSATGTVTFYDKSLHDGDEPWKQSPFGDMLRSRTGREAWVFNDAAALAAHEITFGLGGDLSSLAILLVGQGIGAKLVRDGRVESFPMEIGIFVPVPDVSLQVTPSRSRVSIEAGSGVRFIVASIDKLAKESIYTIEAAAEAARHSEERREVFARAGRGLARGMAAIQAVVDPQAWVVLGPGALVDESTAAARAFMSGLRTMAEHLNYEGLSPAVIIPRVLTGQLAAQAAAAAVLQSEGDSGRRLPTAERSGGGGGRGWPGK